MVFDELLLSHFSEFDMAGKKRSISLGPDVCDVKKEWEEVLCPICMEHPHNAVLLLCSSHANGCRSYICDTSYRHSNCLDRFRKLHTDSTDTNSPPRSPSINLQDSSETPVRQLTLFGNALLEHHGFHNRSERNVSAGRPRDSGEYGIQQNNIGRQNIASLRDQSELAAKSSLKCPLCRGDVLGWTVVEEARKHLNLKPRNCTRESCTFVGNYSELRRHARGVHPRVRPAEVDPSREHAWRRLEHQREHDDIVSAIHSAMPGAVVLGDYVIENSDRLPVERERTSGDVDGPWWLFLQMLESMQSLTGSRSRPRSWTRNGRRPLGGSTRQRYLWGENLLGLQDEEEDGDDSFSDEDELDIFGDVAARNTSPVRRQRRRLNQSRSSSDRL